MEMDGLISEVSVYLNLTHTYQGDLLVNLTSPAGTTVTLHNRTGGGTDNLIGWYPGDMEPSGDLGAFIGEDMGGDWTLFVSDNAGADLGTVNDWCVHVVYDGGVVAVGDLPMIANPVSGGTGLSWQYNPSMFDGFNVYRRTEGTSRVQLNSTLLSSNDGHIQFVDNGAGLTEGQVVYYSYNVVVNGSEMGSSEEVEITFTSGLPTVYALHNNYPNPFNPMTNIKFDLPKASHVKLAVYDIAGRLVKTLVNEVKPAASHSEVWDGTDRTGRRMASGTYYYVLQTEGFKSTHKMMLVK